MYSRRSIKFDPNSELKTFKTNSINHFIERLEIPSSVCTLQEGWCNEASSLKNVTIMPNNKYFKKIDKLIVGKSNIHNDEYDILVFAERDVETATIPPSIKRISMSAFADSRIEKIYIPSNVEEIGEKAFIRCSSLWKVKIAPDSKLRTIKHQAFSQTKIMSISIPPNVSNLNEVLSIYTSKLTNITIMPGNKHFKSYENKLLLGKSDAESEEFDVVILAFRNIKSVLIPQNIKQIASYAFSNSQIEEITIPSHVTHIGDGAFKDCKNLKIVNFAPNSELQVIGKKAFQATSIERVYIPPNVKEIHEETFFYCDQLKFIEIPTNSKLQAIDKWAFGQTLVEEIYLPASISELDSYWCSNMPHLKKITVDSNNKKYKSYSDTFIAEKSNEQNKEYDSLIFVSHDVKSVSIPLNIKKIAPYSFSQCRAENVLITRNVSVICSDAFYLKHINKVEFEPGSNLQKIEYCAFKGSLIKTLVIPSNIPHLDNDFCYHMERLEQVKLIPSNEPNIVLYDNKYLIGKSDVKSDEFDTLLFVPRNTKNISIPPFIKIIGCSAFSDSMINNVFITKNVTKIGSSSFENCSRLKKVDFSHDSNIEEIDSHAFHNSAIQSFYIPSTVTNYANVAFILCNDLKIFELTENLAENVSKKHFFAKDTIVMIPANLRNDIKW